MKETIASETIITQSSNEHEITEYIDPRAELKAKIGSEKYKSLEEFTSKLGTQVPTDSQINNIKSAEDYPLRREYLKDENGIILTTHELDILHKFEIQMEDIPKDEKQLNYLLHQFEAFIKIPIEQKESILKDLYSTISKSYCNRDDVKNQVYPDSSISKTNIAIGIGANLLAPGAGSVILGFKNGWTNTNKCENGLSHLANGISGALVNTLETVVPFSSIIVDKVKESYQENQQQAIQQRKEEIRNGATMSSDEMFKALSDQVILLQKLVEFEKQDPDFYLPFKEKAVFTTDDDLNTDDIEEVHDSVQEKEISQTTLQHFNNSNISQDKLTNFLEDFDNKPQVQNEKKSGLSI